MLNEFLKNSINKCSCLEIDISKCVECGDDPNEDICKKLYNEAPIYDCEVKHLISDSISLLKVFKNIEKKYKQKTHELSKFPPLLIDLDTTQIKSSQKLDSYNKIFDIAKKVFKEGINKKYKSTHNHKGVYNNKNVDFKDIIFYSSHKKLINSSQTGGYPVRHEKYINVK